MEPVAQRRSDGSVGVRLHVQPGARRPGIAGRHGDALRVRVAAPPEGGRANDEVLDLLARALGLPRRTVTLERGATGRRKVVRVESGDPDAVVARLAALAAG